MRIFFTLIIAVILGLNVNAQCTPDPAYAGETFGFWPTLDEGLPVATEGLAYEAPMTVKAPVNAGELNPLYGAYNIDSIILFSVTGLPAGIQYACEDDDCFILGGQLSCMYFFGTTDEVGMHDLVLNFTVYASADFLPDQVVAYPYEGYVLTVEEDVAGGINDLSAASIELSQNVPNPFEDETMIAVNLASDQLLTFEVYNMIGERVYSESVQGRTGTNEIVFRKDNLDSGMYLYSVTANGYTQTKRMVVKR